MDNVTKKQRSYIMSRIRSVSGIEKRQRWMSGLRLRHQPVGIPGSPDFANKSGRIAVFIDGCFWHGCPKHFKTPKTRRKFWADKIRDNKARDRRANRKLRGDGWHVIRVWEHELD